MSPGIALRALPFPSESPNGESTTSSIGASGNSVGYEKQIARFRLDELVLDAVIDHRQQRLKIPRDIQQHDWLGVIAELFTDDDFEKLFKGAKSPGKGDEGVAAGFHDFFSLAHG